MSAQPVDVLEVAIGLMTPTQDFHPFEIYRNGSLVLRLKADGCVEYGENATPDEGARLFWAAVGSRLRLDAAAVAELIEADKEYDAAKAALAAAGWSVPGMGYPKWAERYDAAEERFELADNRRRAALASVQGGQS